MPTGPSGCEWILSWSHAPYSTAPHEVRVTAVGGATGIHTFRASTELHVQNVVAFPNPFDDQLGTVFSFNLASVGPADVLVRVFTTSGRLVYQRVEKGLSPGYHQIRWDGRDSEGQKLANGMYLYRMLVTNGDEKVEHQASLVKLRKPRRDDTGTTP